jgi:phage/plasmid-like protein (TIGR03299 family)
MSHELSYTVTRDANGVETKAADMFSVRETPWHREGVVLPSAPSLDEALKIANLDYTVEKRATSFATKDGSRADSAIAFVTVRADRDVELGSVGAQYTVVQNRDAFAATLGPLIDAGVLTIETGGVLRNGADAWLLCKFDLSKFGPIAQEIFGTEVAPYALVKVNHSGRRNNEIVLTFIRVVCANTLGFVEAEIDGGHETKQGKAIGVIHRPGAQAKMVEAAETLFADLVKRVELVATQYKMLKETTLTASQFRSLVIVPALGVHPSRRKGWNPEAVQAKSVVARYEKKGEELVRLWEQGDGHTGDKSAWEGYNGLVQAVDHDSDLFPTKGGVYRTAAMMHGYLREMKDRAVVELVKFATDCDEAKRLGTSDDLDDVLAATEARAELALAK